VRERLKEDFAVISKLSPDPTLINTNFEPSVYGPIAEGEWVKGQPGQGASKTVCTHLGLTHSID